MSEQTFLLPDVGEGLIEADIVTWKVSVGDVVVLNQPLVDVETAKAIVELPSPFAGRVVTLHATEGETIAVDAPLVTIATDDTATAVPAVEHRREPVLIGFGVADESAPVVRTSRRQSGAAAPAAPARSVPVTRGPVRTSPPVRLLAKQLGIDLATVHGTGRDGVVTRADVERLRASAKKVTSGPDIGARFVGRTLSPWQTMAEEERIPMKGVLKTMADAMLSSVRQAPQAAVWLRLDATATMERLASMKADPAYAGVRLSPSVFLALAFVDAARHFPGINSYVDEATNEVVLRRSVNLGIAADTPRGLVVPSIKNADQLSLVEMANALSTLVETARAGTLTPADMAGTTMTITNVGPFGVDAAVPILPPGTGAILCVGQIAKAPWVVNDEVVVRQVVEISMTFDHRQIDGALASAVIAHVGAFLRQPPLTL